MDASIIVTALVALVAGAGIAAVITLLACRTKAAQSEAALRSERDVASQTIRERNIAIERLGAELAKALAASGSLTESLSSLRAENAALSGRLEAGADSNRQAIEAKTRACNEAIEAVRESCRQQIAIQEESIRKQTKSAAELQATVKDVFAGVSEESLKAANEKLLQLANERFGKIGQESAAELEKRKEAIENLVKPIGETLEKLTRNNVEIEQGIASLSDSSNQLANALRRPVTRGAVGEDNLQVILEQAGLVKDVNFHVQHTTGDEDGDGGLRRADIVVHLPSGRDLVIDSKAPLEAFWDGMNATDDAVRAEKFAAHARLVREHMKQVSQKSYWERYKASPECIVMFLPTEGTYLAAIEADPALLTDARKLRVYLANPMMIVSLIHLASYILKEDRLRQNALQVQTEATILCKRLNIVLGYIAKAGKGIKGAVDSYDDLVKSVDGRLLPQAHKIQAMGVGTGEPLAQIAPLGLKPRQLRSLDFGDGPAAGEETADEAEAVLRFSPGVPSLLLEAEGDEEPSAVDVG